MKNLLLLVKWLLAIFVAPGVLLAMIVISGMLTDGCSSQRPCYIGTFVSLPTIIFFSLTTLYYLIFLLLETANLLPQVNFTFTKISTRIYQAIFWLYIIFGFLILTYLLISGIFINFLEPLSFNAFTLGQTLLR